MNERREHVREIKLPTESEFRFELEAGAPIAIRVVAGNAEVYGSEMAPGRTYVFSQECRAAIYSWEGCTLEATGKTATEYVSEETTMTAYANLHLLLEQMRIRAHRSKRGAAPHPDDEASHYGVEPPRVLVVGPESSGKTTACKIMTNYAVRGPTPAYPLIINLDPGDGGFTIPGSVSACAIDTPIPTAYPANPLGIAATSAPTALSSSQLMPVVHWFGYADLRKNPPLLDRLIRVLGEEVEERFSVDELSRGSGLIIDTPGNFASAPGNDKHLLVKTCVQAFQVNVIIVIGNERLSVEMQKLFDGSYPRKIQIIKIPKSGGVSDLDMAYRDRVQSYQLRHYFYGTPLKLPPSLAAHADELQFGGEASKDLTLTPYSAVLSFDDIKIYRIGQESFAPSSALPIGASRMLGELQPVLLDLSQPGSGVVNSYLALLSIEDSHPTDEEILDADVAGFIVITALNTADRKMTVLAPTTGSLTNRVAVTGSFQYQDI